MPATSLADKITLWKNLVGAVTPRLQEFPHLGNDHGELTTVVTTIEALVVEEDLHTARLREATRRRRDLERQGVDLRARLVTGLQSFFGKRSQELRQFGVDPLLPNVRRRREEEEVPQPPPADAGGEA